MSRLTDTFIQPGESVNLVSPATLTAGQGALIGAIFGIAMNAVAAGASVDFMMEGVTWVDKTAGQTFSQGALVYWDNTAKSATSVSTGNTRIGFATIAALAGDARVAVRLNAAAAPTGA